MLVNHNEILNALKQARNYTAKSDIKPVLTALHVYSDPAKNAVIIESTDTYKLFKAEISAQLNGESVNATIKPVDLPKSWKPCSNPEVYMILDPEALTLKNGFTDEKIFLNRLDAGSFPAFDKIIESRINETETTAISLSVKHLKAIIKDLKADDHIMLDIVNGSPFKPVIIKAYDADCQDYKQFTMLCTVKHYS